MGIDYTKRRDAWMNSTGLKLSNAGNKKVLNFLADFSYPGGFDHSRVYYWPKHKQHILLTEPYHGVEDAVKSLNDLYKSKEGMYLYCGIDDFCYATVDDGRGLWNPPDCKPLIVAKERLADEIDFLIKMLPFKNENTTKNN